MVECTRCGKVFKYESECKRHELSHLPGFGCNKCGKKFTYASALKRHQKQHERTGTVQCDKCNHSFKDEVLLKRHYKYAHEGTKVTHKPKSERRYSCRYTNCNKTFNFSHHLKYHEMTHTNNRQYFCKVCGKGFIQSHNLKVHMKVHESSKRLLCEMANCKKKFISESARTRHYARHKKESSDKESSEILVNTELLSEGIPCSSYEELGLSSCSEEHKSVSTGKNIPSTNDLSVSQPKISVDNCKVGSEEKMYQDTNDSLEYVNSCRTILGKCLVTGDTNGNGDCLCDQMVKIEHKSIKVPEKPAEINKTLLINNKNNAMKTCDDCACSYFKSTKDPNDKIVTEDNIKKVNNDCMPEFEYGVNGIIKVINTVDKELEGIVNVCKNVKSNAKFSKYDAETVPFNSCKAILGTCIVSGSGTISDDCLCAKMLVDDQQMTSQEMEEITPQPNDSTLCL